VRWEMRTRLFLRTMEFLWQEGHTAHATHDEAEEETRLILGIYREFMEQYMAMPVVTGLKTQSEKFAGALRTYGTEAMMQDNKALQAGTSHNLGQNFAKAFELQFQGESGAMEHAWNTSWGVSTRLVGGLVMTHGDDSGLRTPPRLAPIEVVVVPIWKSDDERARLLEAADKLKEHVTGWSGRGDDRIRVRIDSREGIKPGAKYYEWELRGIPLRIELGPRDLEKNSCVTVRRDRKEKTSLPLDGLAPAIGALLDDIQQSMLTAARERREQNSVREPITYDRFRELMEGEGAFVYAGWNGDPAVEARVKAETKATIRCLPDEEFRTSPKPAKCMVTGEAAQHEVVWARAY
jgi:prolyl-tRNA synthetase